jgi:hypothetical protein
MTAPFDEFLTQYAKASESYDRERIAGFFYCPCTFLRGETVVLLDTPEKVREFLAIGFRAYGDSGCVNFVARLLSARSLGKRFGLIDVDWTITSAEGKPVMHFQTTYNLIDDRGQWKIYAITRHDE